MAGNCCYIQVPVRPAFTKNNTNVYLHICVREQGHGNSIALGMTIRKSHNGVYELLLATHIDPV